ncbi:MAG: ZIP family metal transporter [Candidatus Altiarchaeales archaeon]|nr:ZIP family metal transporter [Candidatus Altiarchaeales archaeon]
MALSVFLWILASVVLVSLLSLVGLVSLSLNRKLLSRVLILLVAFASGSMLAASFFHLIPEASERLEAEAFKLVLAGILVFFIIEKFIHWHHCGREECHVKPVGYLNLFGDGVHNFIDGVIIGASYLSSVELGLVTTFVIALHEIPQEFGDFAVLLHAGFKARKALFYNFLSATSAILGGILGFLFLPKIEPLIPSVIAFAAGGFTYIATADLMPELHKENRRSRMLEQTVALLAGILLIYGVLSLLPH